MAGPAPDAADRWGRVEAGAGGPSRKGEPPREPKRRLGTSTSPGVSVANSGGRNGDGGANVELGDSSSQSRNFGPTLKLMRKGRNHLKAGEGISYL